MTANAYRRVPPVGDEIPEAVPDERSRAREADARFRGLMARRHNLIIGNIVGELRGALRDVPCEVHTSGLRVRSPASPRPFSPDVTLVCQAPRFHEEEDALVNPNILFEVIGEDTEAHDRGAKFEAYASIVTLSEYVLVSTTHARVERFLKHADGSWTYRAYGPGDDVPLSTAGCQLAVDEVYLKVFPKAGRP